MIFRTPRRILPFTQISNKLISDPNISGKAKWILIYILSKPENWIVYEKDIVRHGKDGRDAIRSGIHELLAARYISRRRLRDKSGKFTTYEYRLIEVPEITQNVSKDGKSNIGKSAPSNTYLKADEIEATEDQLETINDLAIIEKNEREDQNRQILQCVYCGKTLIYSPLSNTWIQTCEHLC